MGWYPGAVRKPVAYRGLGRRQSVAAACLHTNGGPGSSLYGWWSSVAAKGSTVGAQFQVFLDGTVEQYVDTDLVVFHAYALSRWAVGIEHQDNGTNRTPFSAEQIKATAGILTWLGVPPRMLTSPTPAAGVGYHQQFSQFNQSGHDCPGPVRRAQLPAVLAAMGGTLAGPRSLGPGDSGPDVAALQKALNTFPGSAVTVDGSFGPGTEAAVRAFQHAHGLTPDGIVGPTARSALEGEMPLTSADIAAVAAAVWAHQIVSALPGDGMGKPFPAETFLRYAHRDSNLGAQLHNPPGRDRIAAAVMWWAGHALEGTLPKVDSADQWIVDAAERFAAQVRVTAGPTAQPPSKPAAAPAGPTPAASPH